MNKKLMDCFTNPIKCKLLLEIYSVGRATAKQLSEKYSDIPQATLYRYLKRMTDEGILKIAEENQIRGTIEKTYTLAIPLNTGIADSMDTNPGDALMLMFMDYMMGFMKQFQDYCKRPEIDIQKDMPCFSLAPIYASNEELESAMLELGKIIQGLLANPPAPDRTLRTIGLMVTPPESY